MEHVNEYDIIIIGSGPSGIAAGLYCLQQGKKVILLDSPTQSNLKDDTIESIHPGVQSILNHLKIEADLSNISQGTYNFISDGVNTKSLNPYSEETWNGYHISKNKFVEHLKSEAKKQNITILYEQVAKPILTDKRIIGITTTSGKRLFSKYVIDGSGNQRLTGKSLGFREEIHSPTFVVWTGKTVLENSKFSNPKYAYFIPSYGGWTWIARLDNGEYYWTKLSGKKYAKNSIPDEFTSIKTTVIKSANMRWRIFRPLCIEGLILCGDAAYLIDPAAGQGILNAMMSGIKAGQSAITSIEIPDMESFILAEYDNWCLNQYEEKTEWLREYYKKYSIDLFNTFTKIEDITSN